MTFKDFDKEKNEVLINEIVQSATRLSAHCRNVCEIEDERTEQEAIKECSIFIDEIIYLLNLLNNTKTFERIKTEEIILQAFELKQEVQEMCKQ